MSREQAGADVNARPRATRPVDYESTTTICPACLTDQQTDVCPTDCPTREERR
ncbi:hypothetical protein [Micromonospora sp. NPDC005174]|uniref:hypothetical protein n=1 Tax=Micromonospora sp. NPDC005174 TaxID=3157018 RepID=UPI0033B1D8B3